MRIIVWPRRAWAVCVIVLALLLVGCSKSPTAPDGTDVPTAPPLPPGAQWSVFGEIRLTPSGSVEVGKQVTVDLPFRSPRSLCREYVLLLTNPAGETTAQQRSPRMCGSAGQTTFGGGFLADSAGKFVVAVETYEYDPAGTANPDNPIVRSAEITAR